MCTFGGIICDALLSFALKTFRCRSVITTTLRKRPSWQKRNTQTSRKPFTVNINLRRELAINTREGIIRNNFYLNSFTCCPRGIQKFVFCIWNFFQKSISSWVINRRELFPLFWVQTLFTIVTEELYSCLERSLPRKTCESQVFAKWFG